MAQFEQGESGNPNGRPKGAKNKLGIPLRERIGEFLADNIDQIIIDFKEAKPRERAKIYTDLLPYCLPKNQAVSFEPKIEQLSDEDLLKAINKIIGREDEHTQN